MNKQSGRPRKQKTGCHHIDIELALPLSLSLSLSLIRRTPAVIAPGEQQRYIDRVIIISEGW